MRIFTVGGAVRDELLGLPVQDRDFVVVGATPQMLIARGFRPVGRDFPVFLHPVTHEEYALARTERKSGRGYAGFVFHASPDVSLEEDLARRDLTINAMAKDENGEIIDPFHGQQDLQNRVLRHVSAAFTEDPVRVLRLARFSARFSDFSLAPDTIALAQHMALAGELDHLVPERIWQELSRGLMEETPARLFETLFTCHALPHLLPEFVSVCEDPIRRTRFYTQLNDTARDSAPLPIRFALIVMHSLTSLSPNAQDQAHIDFLCTRLRAPTECRDLARLCARHCEAVLHAHSLSAEALVSLLDSADAFRRPERFLRLLRVSQALLPSADSNSPLDFFAPILAAQKSVDPGSIARACPSASEIPKEIFAARVRAILAPNSTAST